MKHLLFFILALCPMVLFGQGSESFDNIPTSSSTSYRARNWTGNGSISWTATDARTDQTLTGKAITLRVGVLSTSGITGGLGTLTFKYKRVFSGNSTLRIFVNGTQYGSDITVSSTTATTASIPVNVSGAINLELRNSGKRTVIDDISWTASTGGTPACSISSVSATATCNGNNSDVTINYTAANSTSQEASVNGGTFQPISSGGTITITGPTTATTGASVVVRDVTDNTCSASSTVDIPTCPSASTTCTQFINETASTIPTGWTVDDHNNTYWLVGQSADKKVVTKSYDISTYTSVEVEMQVATYGSGTANPATVEYSTDGGTTFTSAGTTATPSSSSYIASGTIKIENLTSVTQFVLRLKSASTSGRGVRIRNLKVCSSGQNTTPMVGFDATTASGAEGTTLNVPVTVSNGTTFPMTVSVTASNLTAEAGDYTLNTNSLTFNANGTQNVQVTLNTDTDIDDETFKLTLAETTSTGITFGNQETTVTITDPNQVPNNITNYVYTCKSGSQVTLTWDSPASDANTMYDGIVILARQGATPTGPGVNDNASGVTANADFSAASNSWGSTAKGKAVYKGTGNTVTITGLTAGQSYTFRAYTYRDANSSVWSTGTNRAATASLNDVTNASAGSNGATKANIVWTNPTSACFDEVMVIATGANGLTFNPTGDGTAYTANAAYSTDPSVVYKGTGTNVEVTGLTAGTAYFFEIYTRKGTDWSAGVEVSATPAPKLNTGDLVFVGFDNNIGGGTDKVSIATLVDLKPKTQFHIANMVYEVGDAANVRSDRWYQCDGTAAVNLASYLITYSGTTDLPKGSVICFELPTSVGTLNTFSVNGVANNDFTGVTAEPLAGNTNFSTSNPDAIWLMQGTWKNETTHYSFDGTVLGGIQDGGSWYKASDDLSALSNGQAKRRSRIHPDLECLAIQGRTTTGTYYNYYDGSKSGTQQELLSSIVNPTNWMGANGSGADNLPASTCQNFTVSGAASQAGVWTNQGVNQDWFDCSNWQNFQVPNENVDVVVDASNVIDANKKSEINYNTPTAQKFANVAKCKSLTIKNGAKVQVQELNTQLEVHGDLTIEAGAQLDLAKGNPSTAGGTVFLKGNLTNSESTDTGANDGNGIDAGSHSTFVFNGTGKQTITGVNGNETAFSTLTINNAAGVEMTTGGNSNVEVGEALNLTAGKVTLNDNTFDIKESCLGNITASNNTAYLQTNGTGKVEVSQVGTTEVQIPVGNSTVNWIHLKNNNTTKQNYDVRVADNINTSYNTSTETETGTDVTKEAIDRVWWVSSASTDTDMTLYWNPTGGYTLPNFDPASVLVSHYTGGAWDAGGASSAVADAHGGMKGVKRTGISSFSPFGAASNADALPVELLSFTGRKANKSVVLNWATATEINNDRFEVEFATNGKDFVQIGKVAGNGNTTEEVAYDFTHDAPVAGVNYYRLKQIDFDGTYEYSKVIEVKFDATSNNVYIRPTIATSRIELVVEKSLNNTAKVQVVDVAGKIVMTSTLVAGKTNLNLNVADLAKGHYFVKVTGMNQTFTTRFIKK